MKNTVISGLLTVALSLVTAQTMLAAVESPSPLCQDFQPTETFDLFPNSVFDWNDTGAAGEQFAVGLSAPVLSPGDFVTIHFIELDDLDNPIQIAQVSVQPFPASVNTYTLPNDGRWRIYLSYTDDVDAPIVDVSIGCTAVAVSVTPDGACDNVTDGRVNSDPALDCAAPVAVYWSDAGLDVYSVNPDNGDGVFTVRLTQAEIDAAGEGNVLLAEVANPYTGHTIRVYKVAGGLIQINTTYADGKEYTIQFNGSTFLYHIAA